MQTAKTIVGVCAGLLMALTVTAHAAPTGPAKGPLHVHPANPRYFTDGAGRAVCLTGFEYWDLLDANGSVRSDAMDFARFLDVAEQYGANFVRLWRWNELAKFRYSRDGAAFQSSPSVYARTGPGAALDGKPKFDLTKFDQDYFDHLRVRVIAAGKRGFYVSVMLFEGHSLQFSDQPWRWDGHPFNPNNNINAIDNACAAGGSPIDIHTLRLSSVTAVQEAYVREVIDTVNDLDNVLYEIANESHVASADWQYHIIRYIKEYESNKPKQHPVWMSSHRGGPADAVLFAAPADCISPGPEGGWRDNPPPADGRKIVLSNTDHLWGAPGSHVWVWKTFLRGHNVINYMELDQLLDPTPKLENARRAMARTQALARRVNLAAMIPHPELASAAYCLADPANEYIVYLPAEGEVTIDLSAASGPITVEWLHPIKETFVVDETTQGGAKRTLASPLRGDAVLHLKAVTSLVERN